MIPWCSELGSTWVDEQGNGGRRSQSVRYESRHVNVEAPRGYKQEFDVPK
jgi:hypothetical protein